MQSIQGELVKITSISTEIDKRIKVNSKNFKEVKDDPSYSEDQKQLYKYKLSDLKTKQQAKLEILSKNRKNVRTQVAKIKRPLNMYLMKINLWRNEIVPYFASRVL